MYPSDEQELNRLDIHHNLMLRLLNGHLHFAPIGAGPQRVLDIGTGTGNWAVDFGKTEAFFLSHLILTPGKRIYIRRLKSLGMT